MLFWNFFFCSHSPFSAPLSQYLISNWTRPSYCWPWSIPPWSRQLLTSEFFYLHPCSLHPVCQLWAFSVSSRKSIRSISSDHSCLGPPFIIFRVKASPEGPVWCAPRSLASSPSPPASLWVLATFFLSQEIAAASFPFSLPLDDSPSASCSFFLPQETKNVNESGNWPQGGAQRLGLAVCC